MKLSKFNEIRDSNGRRMIEGNGRIFQMIGEESYFYRRNWGIAWSMGILHDIDEIWSRNFKFRNDAIKIKLLKHLM